MGLVLNELFLTAASMRSVLSSQATGGIDPTSLDLEYVPKRSSCSRDTSNTDKGPTHN